MMKYMSEKCSSMDIYQRETKEHPAENRSGANCDKLRASHLSAANFQQRNPVSVEN